MISLSLDFIILRFGHVIFRQGKKFDIQVGYQILILDLDMKGVYI